MCSELTSWEKAVDFHGHACPGLAVGYRAAEAALNVIGSQRDVDEELVAIVENDSCSVDAIQSVFSCTVGKGNMIFSNTGKQVFTIGSRKTGKAVRVALKFNAFDKPAGSKEDKMNQILESPIDELFDIRETELALPQKARLFQVLQCTGCGEGVMESKARLQEGKVVCPACAGEYTRGW